MCTPLCARRRPFAVVALECPRALRLFCGDILFYVPWAQALASKKKQWAATSFAERRELALKSAPGARARDALVLLFHTRLISHPLPSPPQWSRSSATSARPSPWPPRSTRAPTRASSGRRCSTGAPPFPPLSSPARPPLPSLRLVPNPARAAADRHRRHTPKPRRVIGTSFMLDAAETLKRLDAREEPARRLTTLGPEAVRGIIDVYPLNWFDSFLLPGTRAQVYLKPGAPAASGAHCTRQAHSAVLPMGCVPQQPAQGKGQAGPSAPDGPRPLPTAHVAGEKRVVSGRTALQRFRGPGELCTILVRRRPPPGPFPERLRRAPAALLRLRAARSPSPRLTPPRALSPRAPGRRQRLVDQRLRRCEQVRSYDDNPSISQSKPHPAGTSTPVTRNLLSAPVSVVSAGCSWTAASPP